MQDELISVIVPIYNVKEYLKECVDSISNQTYSKLEIILVDDGSTDGSGQLCDEISKSDSRIHVFHKTNGGLSSARNYGIDHSTGTLLAFIDSDDFILPEMISQLNSDIKESQADMAICNYSFLNVDKSIGFIPPKFSEKIIIHSPSVFSSVFDDFPAWNKLYRRELFKEIRYPEGKLYEDARTMYRLAYAAKTVSYNPQAFYINRIRHGSIMRTFNSENYMDRVNVWNEILSFSDGKTDKQTVQRIRIRKNKLVIELLMSVTKSKAGFSLLSNLFSQIDDSEMNRKAYSKKEFVFYLLIKPYVKIRRAFSHEC